MNKPGEVTSEDVFAAAPRGYVDIPVGAVSVRAYEVSIFERMQYQAFVKSNLKNSELCMAELVRLACPAMADKSADEIRQRLKPEALLALFMACQKLAGMDAKEVEDKEKKD